MPSGADDQGSRDGVVDQPLAPRFSSDFSVWPSRTRAPERLQQVVVELAAAYAKADRALIAGLHFAPWISPVRKAVIGCSTRSLA